MATVLALAEYAAPSHLCPLLRFTFPTFRDTPFDFIESVLPVLTNSAGRTAVARGSATVVHVADSPSVFVVHLAHQTSVTEATLAIFLGIQPGLASAAGEPIDPTDALRL